MRGVASTLAQTQAADPDRFAPVESMTADVTPCGRNDDGLFGRSNHATKYRYPGEVERCCGYV